MVRAWWGSALLSGARHAACSASSIGRLTARGAPGSRRCRSGPANHDARANLLAFFASPFLTKSGKFGPIKRLLSTPAIMSFLSQEDSSRAKSGHSFTDCTHSGSRRRCMKNQTCNRRRYRMASCNDKSTLKRPDTAHRSRSASLRKQRHPPAPSTSCYCSRDSQDRSSLAARKPSLQPHRCSGLPRVCQRRAAR